MGRQLSLFTGPYGPLGAIEEKRGQISEGALKDLLEKTELRRLSWEVDLTFVLCFLFLFGDYVRGIGGRRPSKGHTRH